MIDKPFYADFDSAQKFQAIQGIIARRLKEHPNAYCSYSGGSDSDILIDLIERTREIFSLPPIHYAFFNTGLEMKATKDHVKATAEKYGVEIEIIKPKVGIVQAVRKYGIPFISKLTSEHLEGMQKKKIPFSLWQEFDEAEDKQAKLKELCERYPRSQSYICFICGCTSKGKLIDTQSVVTSSKYLRDFLVDYPPDFQISAKCCNYCKKQPAKEYEKNFDMIITGERQAEGGVRSVSFKTTQDDPNNTMCFYATARGFRFRPLYYVSDKDKDWYKKYYNIRYSDAYEVYGLKRVGCCGCSISYRVLDDLKLIEPYEPNVVKAAWNVFGKSYTYRQKYTEYRKLKNECEDSPDGLFLSFKF